MQDKIVKMALVFICLQLLAFSHYLSLQLNTKQLKYLSMIYNNKSCMKKRWNGRNSARIFDLRMGFPNLEMILEYDFPTEISHLSLVFGWDGDILVYLLVWFPPYRAKFPLMKKKPKRRVLFSSFLSNHKLTYTSVPSIYQLYFWKSV